MKKIFFGILFMFGILIGWFYSISIPINDVTLYEMINLNAALASENEEHNQKEVSVTVECPDGSTCTDVVCVTGMSTCDRVDCCN